MHKEKFFRLLTRIYFLNIKKTKGVTVTDFKNWKKNECFIDLFEKVNKIMIGKWKNKIKPTYQQKKRLYAMYKFMVST